MLSKFITRTAHFVCALAVFGVSSFCGATDSVKVSEKDQATVKTIVLRLFPEAHIQTVLPTPSPHLFVAADGVQMIYVDTSSQLLFVGTVLDGKNKVNLTQYHQRLIVKNILKTLDVSTALKDVRGSGHHVVYVFEDPYCKYCRQLIHEMAILKDVTIYTFVTPMLKEESYSMAHRIMCHKDPLATWENWMKNYQAPSDSKETCMMDGLEKNIAVAHSLGIRSVPTLVFTSGDIIPGMVKLSVIEEHIREAGKTS